MKCRKARYLISPYLDRELSGDDLIAFEDHLKSCSDCRHETDELRSLLALVVKPAEVPVPSRLYYSIRERLHHQEPIARGSWWKPASAPVLAVVMFALSVFFGIQLATRIIVHSPDPQIHLTASNLDLVVFNDEPQSSMAAAFNRLASK